MQALGVRENFPDKVAFAVSPPFAWVSADGGLIQRWWMTAAVVAGWHCCGRKLPMPCLDVSKARIDHGLMAGLGERGEGNERGRQSDSLV